LVERIFDKRAVRISSASSHSISTKSAAPRSLPGLRFSGFLSLNEAHLVALDRDLDTAAARAHVARREVRLLS
jgi:hypothetical protein